MTDQNPRKTHANGDRYPVRIGEKNYSPEFQLKKEFAKSWKSVLSSNHKKEYAVCMCPGSGNKRLKICRKENPEMFYLSKYPDTGEEHSVSCQFYAPVPEKSGLQGYAIGVVEHLSDGGKRIRMQLGLRQNSDEQPSEAPDDRPARSGGVKQSSMRLLGLLHFLWDEAALNRWYPKMAGKRDAGRVGYWVLSQAREIRTSRMVLSDVFLTHAKKGWREEQRNRTVSALAKEKRLRLVAVDDLARYDESKYPFPLSRVPFSGPAGMPFAYIPKPLWELTEKRFGKELSAWKAGRRVVAIAQIEVADCGKNDGRICDVGLMVVSDEWIPVESSYEALVEGTLRDQERAFFKPLRYDADEDCVFPDFWLLDVGQDYPMEVYGMSTPAYLARKAVKKNHYDEKYGANGWWYWDAASQPTAEHIPSFPRQGSHDLRCT